jgi:hypothetical protein
MAVMPYEDYEAACNKIREHSGKTETIKSGDLATEIEGIAGGGGGDNYLLYSQTARFGNLNLFGKAEVVIDMPYITSVAMIFRPDVLTFGSSACLNRTVEHITFNSESEKITQAYQMFYFAEPWDGETALKHITLNMDMSKVTSANFMFNGCSLLETIDGTPLDFSSVVDSTVTLMTAAPKVSYIRFAPNTIKCNLNMSGSRALTNESIQSIIDGLSSTENGKTLTLSQTAVNNAFGGSDTTEWLTLIATKPNWTISLA